MSNQLLNIYYLKLDLAYNIIEHSKNFLDFCGLNEKNLIGLNFNQIFKNRNQEIPRQLEKIQPDESKSILIFKNNINNHHDSIILIYATIKRNRDTYIIKFVNWLNWLHNINLSLESNFHTIANLDEKHIKAKFNYLTEAYWFKALLPLTTYLPHQFANLISSHVIFKIMRIFNNKRGENKYSKDYNRDTISRVKNKIRKDTGIEILDLKMIAEDHSLVNLHRGNQLIIRESSLKTDIVVLAAPDLLLECLMAKL